MKTIQIIAIILFITSLTNCSSSENKEENTKETIAIEDETITNGSQKENQVTVNVEDPTLITGQFPEFNDLTMVNLSDMGNIEISHTKLFITGPNYKKRCYLEGYTFGDMQREYIISIEELEKGTSYRIKSYSDNEEKTYEFKKNTEHGWWDLTSDKQGYAISFADTKWMNDYYQRYEYVKIAELSPKLETFADFISYSAGFTEVVNREGDLVLLTNCDVKPLRLEFWENDYDGTGHLRFSEGDKELDPDLSFAAIRLYDYHIEIDYMNSIGDVNSVKTGRLFFNHHKVTIGGSDFEWNTMILESFFNIGWERVFVPDGAQDRYDIVNIPCKD
jgi:hypothetical protein